MGKAFKLDFDDESETPEIVGRRLELGTLKLELMLLKQRHKLTNKEKEYLIRLEKKIARKQRTYDFLSDKTRRSELYYGQSI